ncbi:DUF4097 family beta strand repeat-containing protein [Bacillus sp. FJAT-45350]|uniref:DUF4097 family beta strand repeat-containing protein n=1 Tax=Bacillus sp. FJAT-45350 TaxID=2011014 RepID=UPI0015C70AC4|nr:DUF4097 family beta strand repeat-containing protein [Bacillus sp. FJAT-45350]
MKKIVGILLIFIGAVVGIMTVTQSFSKQVNIQDKQEFGLEQIEKVEIVTSSTDVNIFSTSDSGITVDLHGRSSQGDVDLVTRVVGSTLRVEVSKRNRWFSFGRSHVSLKLDLPEQFQQELHITSSSGDISIHDEVTLDVFSAKMSSGDVKSVRGTINMLTFVSSSGDFNGTQLQTNEISLSSSSGNIVIDGVSGEIRGRTSSGDVFLSYINENGTIDFQTSSGDIELHIPQPSFTLEVNTSSGSVVSNLPISYTSLGKRNYIGTVGDGANQINIRTSSGEVVIR